MEDESGRRGQRRDDVRRVMMLGSNKGTTSDLGSVYIAVAESPGSEPRAQAFSNWKPGLRTGSERAWARLLTARPRSARPSSGLKAQPWTSLLATETSPLHQQKGLSHIAPTRHYVAPIASVAPRSCYREHCRSTLSAFCATQHYRALSGCHSYVTYLTKTQYGFY